MNSKIEENDTSFFKRYSFPVLAFFIFGLMPIYWDALHHVDSSIILLHRSFWVAITLLPYFLFTFNLKNFCSAIKKNWGYLLLSSLCMTTNWGGYIYAVNHGFVMEASLAYYISPILSIILSLIFLKEKVNTRQTLSISLVALAIIYLLIAKGIFPKYSFMIGSSFACYGLLSKYIPFRPLERLLIESICITFFLFIFLQNPVDSYHQFIQYESSTQWLLVFTGSISIIPLSLYIASIKLVKFTTIGVLSFILPSMVFFLGVFYFHQPLDQHSLFTMLLIWPSIGLYIFDLCKSNRVPVPTD